MCINFDSTADDQPEQVYCYICGDKLVEKFSAVPPRKYYYCSGCDTYMDKIADELALKDETIAKLQHTIDNISKMFS